jgi:hypothetical protein
MKKIINISLSNFCTLRIMAFCAFFAAAILGLAPGAMANPLDARLVITFSDSPLTQTIDSIHITETSSGYPVDITGLSSAANGPGIPPDTFDFNLSSPSVDVKFNGEPEPYGSPVTDLILSQARLVSFDDGQGNKVGPDYYVDSYDYATGTIFGNIGYLTIDCVPDTSSTLGLLGLGALSLLAYDWRRLKEKAYGKLRLPQQ